MDEMVLCTRQDGRRMRRILLTVLDRLLMRIVWLSINHCTLATYWLYPYPPKLERVTGHVWSRSCVEPCQLPETVYMTI